MKVTIPGLILLWSSCLTYGAANPIISSGPRSGTQPQSGAGAGINFPPQEQLVQGLKEALEKGIQQAVAELGHDGGFLTNLQVRIPMPPRLQTVDKTLRVVGESQLADQFVATLNHAAEQAVPQATAVFIDAVRHMTIADAKSILTGPSDAATQYFRRVTATNVYQRFLPIVKSVTDKTGVTSSYKRLLDTVSQNKYLGAIETVLLNGQPVDIDAYVTDHALDGLFKMMAEEEARIRQDPLARTTQLLQKVFGALYNGTR